MNHLTMRAHSSATTVLAAVIAIIVSVSGVFGATDKCQIRLEKETQKLRQSIGKALQVCADAVRRDQVAGRELSKAADKCEHALSRVYGLGADPAASATGKFVDRLNRLYPSTCTEADLTQLGHLVSGLNAPGAGPMQFATTWLFVAAETQAAKQQFSVVGDLRPLLDAVIVLGGRPNLGYLDARSFPACHNVSCTLTGTSGISLHTDLGTIPVGVGGRQIGLQICRVPATGLPLGGNDSVLLMSEPTSTLQPPPTILGNTVCIETARSQGWCDCAPAPPSGATDPSLCLDLVGTPGPGTDRCGAPLGKKALVTSWAGSSVAGNCVGTSFIQYRIEPPANVGPDGTACTTDDTVSYNAPSQAGPFTTGSSTSTLYDSAGGTRTASVGPGSGISCTQLETGSLSGLKIVGTFPAANQPMCGDTITTFTLQCS